MGRALKTVRFRNERCSRRVSSSLRVVGLGVVMAACSASMNPPARVGITVSGIAPTDIAGGAYNASLEQAATYAWNEFIALNWSAVNQNGALGTRGAAEINNLPEPTGPRVWETLRAKTEVFPGAGSPHGFRAGPGEDYGYDEAPDYRYDPESVGVYPGLEAGQVPACSDQQQGLPVPMIELSESHEVGPERLYSGMAPVSAGEETEAAQRVLFAVKVNRTFYRYVVENGWLDGGNAGSTIPAESTQDYIQLHGRAPEAGSTGTVSFPDGTLQIKTAWRRLSEEEKNSGRFHTAWARSYQNQDPSRRYRGIAGDASHPCYVDSEWGLIAMHIKTKTASAPYYIWATFEHQETLSDRIGRPVEDAAGRLVRNRELASTDPAISVRNASGALPTTPDTIQKQSPGRADAQPGRRLYYSNTSGTPTTQGLIALNRRDHEIPPPVIDVNEAAQETLKRYLGQHTGWNSGIPSSLVNYKLVGIQWKPANKPVPGQDLKPSPEEKDEVLRYPLIYYLANSALETSYRLQNYSGTVQPRLPPPYQELDVQDLLTDFDSRGKPVVNVAYAGLKPDGVNFGFNMGGCMGCHGQIQIKGYDFNFIFRRGRINAPETGDYLRKTLAEMVHGSRNDD